MTWRAHNAETTPCPECNGTGIESFVELDAGGYIIRIFGEDELDEWDALPPDVQGTTDCPHCDGHGYI